MASTPAHALLLHSLRERLCNDAIPEHVMGLAEERASLVSLLKSSVCQGESNSLLVVGPRGSGKSLLLKLALEHLAHDPDVPKDAYTVIWLNGLVHGDDKAAMREIALQLSLEWLVKDIDGLEGEGGGNAGESEHTEMSKDIEDASTRNAMNSPLRRQQVGAGVGSLDQEEHPGSTDNAENIALACTPRSKRTRQSSATKSKETAKKTEEKQEGCGEEEKDGQPYKIQEPSPQPSDQLLPQSQSRVSSLSSQTHQQMESATAATASGITINPTDAQTQPTGVLRLPIATIVRSLLDALKAADSATAKCLVLVLDEFDIFAHTGKQGLLYALFDAAQAGHAPLAIVGLTCRLDALTLLEKRVLSRFSHRQILLFKSVAFAEYVELFRQSLLPPHDFSDALLAREWTKSVNELVENGYVRQALQSLYDTNHRDVRALHTLAMGCISQANAEPPFLHALHLFHAHQQQWADCKVDILLDLSTLEVCLVLAFYLASRKHAPLHINFEIAFDEYRQFAMDPKNRSVEYFGKDVAFKAFQHLCALELIMPAEGTASASARTVPLFRSMRLMLEAAQLADLLDKYPNLPTHLKVWARPMLLM